MKQNTALLTIIAKLLTFKAKFCKNYAKNLKRNIFFKETKPNFWSETKRNEAKKISQSFAKRKRNQAKQFAFRLVSLWSETFLEAKLGHPTVWAKNFETLSLFICVLDADAWWMPSRPMWPTTGTRTKSSFHVREQSNGDFYTHRWIRCKDDFWRLLSFVAAIFSSATQFEVSEDDLRGEFSCQARNLAGLGPKCSVKVIQQYLNFGKRDGTILRHLFNHDWELIFHQLDYW